LDDVSFSNDLLRFCLDFLQADDVRVEFLKYFRKSFFHDCSDTVYIPGDHFHREILKVSVIPDGYFHRVSGEIFEPESR
jgi:hypothetical protein